MLNYILKRTILSFVFLVLIVFMVYLLQTQFKGDPFEAMLQSQDKNAVENHAQALISAKLADSNGHIKEPIVRLGEWIKGIFSGDWGQIYTLSTNAKTVPGAIFTPLRTSMLVAIPAYILGTIFGIGLGLLSGYKRGKTTDYIITWFVSIFISVPSFVIAALAIIVGPKINLPTSFENAVGLSYMVKTLILPILVITLMSLSGWTYQLRSEIGGILASDYILAARTKGYSEWFIFKRYVLRNALYPFAGALATGFMAAFASSIIVERFFNIQGSTSLLVAAAKAGEVNILLANSLIFGLIGLGTGALAEFAQFSINPVVRSSFATGISVNQKIKSHSARSKERKRIQLAEEVGHD